MLLICSSFIEALKYNVSGFETDYDDLLFYDEEGNDVTEEGMREFEHLDVAFDEMVSQVTIKWLPGN